jgi:hypothetical protein
MKELKGFGLDCGRRYMYCGSIYPELRAVMVIRELEDRTIEEGERVYLCRSVDTGIQYEIFSTEVSCRLS